MKLPISTGQCAHVLGVSEPGLNNLVRKARITPPPTVIAGRRQWERHHILQAADHLGLLTDELRRGLDELTSSALAAATTSEEVRHG